MTDIEEFRKMVRDPSKREEVKRLLASEMEEKQKAEEQLFITETFQSVLVESLVLAMVYLDADLFIKSIETTFSSLKKTKLQEDYQNIMNGVEKLVHECIEKIRSLEAAIEIIKKEQHEKAMSELINETE